AYMKPRMRPSMRTWGRMLARRAKSIRTWGRGPVTPPPGPSLRGGRRGDGEALGLLVLAPLLGIVVRDLQYVVRGFLGIALVVELDRPRHAAVLDLADRLRHRGAGGGLAAARHRLQRL